MRLNLGNEAALKRFVDLYRVFLKFVNNDSDVKLMCSEPFDVNKTDEVHENTYNEKKKLNAFYDSVMNEACKIEDEYFRLLELKDIKEFKGIKEKIKKMEEKLDFYDDFLYERIPFHDYYFSYNGQYYSLDIDSDVYNIEFDTGEGQFVDCDLIEYNSGISSDDEDISRAISFVYNKKDKALAYIYDVKEHFVDYDGNLIISGNKDELDAQMVMKRL